MSPQCYWKPTGRRPFQACCRLCELSASITQHQSQCALPNKRFNNSDAWSVCTDASITGRPGVSVCCTTSTSITPHWTASQCALQDRGLQQTRSSTSQLLSTGLRGHTRQDQWPSFQPTLSPSEGPALLSLTAVHAFPSL